MLRNDPSQATDDDEEDGLDQEAAEVEGATTDLGHEPPGRDGSAHAESVLTDRKVERGRDGDAGLLQEEGGLQKDVVLARRRREARAQNRRT